LFLNYTLLPLLISLVGNHRFKNSDVWSPYYIYPPVETTHSHNQLTHRHALQHLNST